MVKFKENIEIINEFKKINGEDRAIAMLLMSLHNALRHLAEHVDKQKWDGIMNDPVIAMSANYSMKFKEAGEVVFKRNGFMTRFE